MNEKMRTEVISHFSFPCTGRWKLLEITSVVFSKFNLPSTEKIAEAHNAARSAVGASAFDDLSVAVDHLKKSLELLTNPSASQ